MYSGNVQKVYIGRILVPLSGTNRIITPVAYSYTVLLPFHGMDYGERTWTRTDFQEIHFHRTLSTNVSPVTRAPLVSLLDVLRLFISRYKMV